MWGSNIYGQLGKKTKQHVKSIFDSPVKLTFPAPISFITCKYSTTAAIDVNGKLYIWGKNKISDNVYINYNVPFSRDFNYPKEVEFMSHNNNSKNIFNFVAIGMHHIIVTTVDGYVNVWDSDAN